MSAEDALGRAPALPAGFVLRSYATLGSTNDEAAALAAQGAAAGTVVWALEQSGGRGRRGRSWSSPPGNLYCSVILKPQRPALEAAQVSFLAALALAEALEPHLPPGRALRCKWPNDLLLDGRKVAGILLESASGGTGRVDWLIVGTGVNVAHFPAAAEWPATALAEAGVSLSVTQVLEGYVAALARWLDRWTAEGFDPVRRAWQGRAAGLGQAVRVRLATETLTGVFADLDADGALVLEGPAGTRRITAGDVFFS